jgi:adenylate kinase family enzyme
MGQVLGDTAGRGLATDIERPRRICVIGRAGSGKTTAALSLSKALGIPVVHLDQLYWGRDWRAVSGDSFHAADAAAISKEAWILDGGYISTPSFAERVERAELVVITEASLVRCLSRVLWRSIAYGGRPRGDRPDGADEAFSLTFLIWIVRWTRKHPDLPAEIAAIDPRKPIAIVQRVADLQRVVAA